MLIFILSLTSCNSNDYNIYFTADDEFMSEIEIYNSLHENIISSEFNDSLEKYMYSYEKKEVGFSWSELKSLTISDLGKWKLTEMCIRDRAGRENLSAPAARCVQRIYRQ